MIMQTKTFKKPAKWLENLMLIWVPVAVFLILCAGIYFQVFVYHPSNFHQYHVQAPR